MSGRQASRESSAQIRVWPDLPKAIIHPTIYGHFAEHLGRCIYEGIWVGPESRVPNEGGIRLDVLAALKQLRAPVVRWPGGCFGDAYHWRDGIGPAEKRPETVNMWWHQTEPNTFGTDEFMRFCTAVGCAPYLSLNVGTGTPQEALEWLEYCNFAGESSLTRLRRRNGQAEPYGVKYWGVGNENWGCGGRLRAADYAKEYRRYATFLKALDPSIELVACGHGACTSNGEGAAWNLRFCEEMGSSDLIEHLSIHRYFARGGGVTFSDSEYRALFADLAALERDIQAADQVLGYFYPEKRVGLAIDEWGVWHPRAKTENGNEQESSLRDAVFAGACLNLFNRYAHRISMANIAQTINVLQSLAMTDGGKMYLTPTYHVFDMMRPHMGAQSITQELECDCYDAHPVGMPAKQAIPALSISASLSAPNRLFLTVANQTPDEAIEARIVVKGSAVQAVSGRALMSGDPRDENSFEHPKTVIPKRIKGNVSDGRAICTFPAHSFTAMALNLG